MTPTPAPAPVLARMIDALGRQVTATTAPTPLGGQRPSPPLTPADRASLIARAKRAAVPVANCVAGRLKSGHITGEMTREELEALIIVLAEAADHALLREVCATDDDDGQPDATPADLRRAHTEAGRLRRDGMVVPNSIRILDNAYHEALRARKRELVAADELRERRSRRGAA